MAQIVWLVWSKVCGDMYIAKYYELEIPMIKYTFIFYFFFLDFFLRTSHEKTVCNKFFWCILHQIDLYSKNESKELVIKKSEETITVVHDVRKFLDSCEVREWIYKRVDDFALLSRISNKFDIQAAAK